MAARLPWLKIWTEARNDRKLEALTDRQHRIWFKLLCFSAEAEPRGVIDYSDPELVAVELGVGVDDLEDAIARMVRLTLLAREDEFVHFPAFAERQYDKPSDRPEATAARKAKERLSR